MHSLLSLTLILNRRAMQDPEQNVGFLMGDVARLIRRNFTQRAAAHGLSLAQWRALAFLARQQGVNQVTLADRLEIQPITLARLIDRLQEAGLVARRPDPDDRRAFLLYLTDAAQPLIEQMRRYGADTRAAALAGLPGEDRAALLRALQPMKQNLLEAKGAASTADSPGNADWTPEHTAGRHEQPTPTRPHRPTPDPTPHPPPPPPP